MNGFKPGDPEIVQSGSESVEIREGLPDEADVVIVGCGPAGLTLAAQLSQYSNIKTIIVDQKSGPLELGQADGIACRTMEMFEAFSFSEKVLKEAYWVNETAFWKPDSNNEKEIIRSSRIQDTEDGLSEFPHVILNQARVHDFLMEKMRNNGRRLKPYYNLKLTNLYFGSFSQRDIEENSPVNCTFEESNGGDKGKVHNVKTRFVVGCDGARSTVRNLLKINLKGDATNQIWGVMDILAVTDFPDIRLKSVVHSAKKGNLLIIPREGGYLIRIYIELYKLSENERLSSRNIKLNDLINAAKGILHPFQLEVKEVAWWSVYEIGQRLADRFDNRGLSQKVKSHANIFIVGDACHTHSPKAGQGMNVAMADSFNLGWKLGAVLTKQASPKLLNTYSEERRAIANELIEFDKEFARMFSARPKGKYSKDNSEIDPKEFERYFTKFGRFTAGTATRYEKSLIIGSPKYQHLARGFTVGSRFHSAQVIRFFDAKQIQLGHTIKADGRWRIFIFFDKSFTDRATSKVHDLCFRLSEMETSPLKKYTSNGCDIDSVIDVRAICQAPHQDLSPDMFPPLLTPIKGKYNLVDYEKIFCPVFKTGQNIFEIREINKDEGCIVIVRPDQYISQVFALDNWNGVCSHFDKFMLKLY